MGFKILVFILILFITNNNLLYSKQQNCCLNCHAGHYFHYKGCNKCHRGIMISKRKNIAHFRLILGRFAYFRFPKSKSIVCGLNIIKREGCRRCHIILNKGNQLATDLDLLSKEIPISDLISYLNNPVMYMPNFRFSGDQIEYILNVILRGIFFNNKKNKHTFYIIHFKNPDTTKEDPFTINCGGCHKVLTKSLGGLGTGNSGPNLSGLFSKYYPSKNIVFTEEKLITWIQNPRKLDNNSLMLPVNISVKKIQRITTILKN